MTGREAIKAAMRAASDDANKAITQATVAEKSASELRAKAKRLLEEVALMQRDLDTLEAPIVERPPPPVRNTKAKTAK